MSEDLKVLRFYGNVKNGKDLEELSNKALKYGKTAIGVADNGKLYERRKEANILVDKFRASEVLELPIIEIEKIIESKGLYSVAIDEPKTTTSEEVVTNAETPLNVVIEEIKEETTKEEPKAEEEQAEVVISSVENEEPKEEEQTNDELNDKPKEEEQAVVSVSSVAKEETLTPLVDEIKADSVEMSKEAREKEIADLKLLTNNYINALDTISEQETKIKELEEELKELKALKETIANLVK
jgi:hypothetical protein